MTKTPGARDPLAAALFRRDAAGSGNRVNSRAALLDAAIAEFAAKGYEATTVAAIARRAGVTTGALYAHFPGKLDLLLAAIGLAPVDELDGSATELSALPASAVASWLRRALGAAPDERMVLLLDVIVVARRDTRIATALRSGLEAYVRATTRVVEAAAAGGSVTPVIGPAEVARLLALIRLGRTVFAGLAAPAPASRSFDRIGDVILQPAILADDEHSDDDPGSSLSRVRSYATAVQHAENALHDAIADAVDRGCSLRRVGVAAGVSHERVRRILQERG